MIPKIHWHDNHRTASSAEYFGKDLKLLVATWDGFSPQNSRLSFGGKDHVDLWEAGH